MTTPTGETVEARKTLMSSWFQNFPHGFYEYILFRKKSVKTESELNFPCFVYDTPLLTNDTIYQSNYCGAIISKKYIHKPNYIGNSILISNIHTIIHTLTQ